MWRSALALTEASRDGELKSVRAMLLRRGMLVMVALSAASSELFMSSDVALLSALKGDWSSTW